MSKSTYRKIVGLFSLLVILAHLVPAFAVVQNKTGLYTDWLKVGGTTTPAANVAFEVNSTTKVGLFPRMTTTQRDAISSPPDGSLIFNTTTGKYNFYGSSSWQEVGAGTAITALTGDVTAAGPGSSAATLATVNSNVGSFGSATVIPSFTVNGKGLITAVTTNTVGNATTATALAADPTDCAADRYATTIAASGNLTCAQVTNAGLAGSIAAAKLIGSDIATLGTVTTGTWSATAIAETKGGTNQTSYTTGDVLYASASNTLSKRAIGTTGQVFTVNSSGVPAWASAAVGDKNYLQTINGTNNNGNFELGATTGWALGVTGTLTNGIPTGTPTFGSGASGNLSITTVSSGLQNSGSYSLSYVSSAATTAGNMVASPIFNLDKSDNSKLMTVSFTYRAASNPTNANWSGTSSNSFAWAVYDGTNATWIPPTGGFCMTQSSGVGTCVGTFQTSATGTQFQFAIYNANATSGAVTVYFDDFYLGPQTAPIGPVVTDWVSFTPTGAWSTNTTYTGQWRRVGDSAEYDIKVATSGAPTSATLTVNLPSGHVIDTNKLSAGTNTYGIPDSDGLISDSGTTTWPAYVDYSSTTAVVVRTSNALADTRLAGPGVTQAVPFTFGAGDGVHIHFKVPISGWSSNVQMSNDTDTRVVAAYLSTASTQSIGSASAVKITGWSASVDTHAAFSSGSQVYVVPVSGIYKIKWNAAFSSAAVGGSSGVVQLRTTVNGSAVTNDFAPGGGTAAQVRGGATTVILSLKANDQVQFDIYQDTGTTLSLIGGGMSATIERLSGPAVIAATETVNMVYGLTVAQAVAANAVIKYDTRVDETHNGMFSTSTGLATIPVSGRYRIKAAGSAGGAMSIFVKVNGTAKGYLATAAATYVTAGDMILPLNAGDTVGIYSDSNVTFTATSGTYGYLNYFTLTRVGN